jgi:hypothetical protein
MDAVLGAYSIWNALVGKYSRSSLTVETDKLSALSGTAKKIQSLINDEYVAGLWKRHIIHHLLWFALQPPPEKRPQSYLAPSWSWASIDAKILNASSITQTDGKTLLAEDLLWICM